MLENVKKLISKDSRKTFEEVYIDYILNTQLKSIEIEFEYVKKHNRLDVLNLDKWINATLREAI